jgi:hypothetical protein
MIDSVRQTVQALLNKNNYGYLSPGDFNLFALQAQMDLFKDYFDKYNAIVNAENARQAGIDYADLKKSIAETLEIFLVLNFAPTYTSANEYTLPTNLYMLDAAHYVPNADSGAGWFSDNNKRDIEKVSGSRINAMLRSSSTAPTQHFPAYVFSGSTLLLYPESIAGNGKVTINYFRFPLAPKWTYSTLSGGEPIFNSGAADYQDFELPDDDEPRLVSRILSMAGLSIREEEVMAIAAQQQQ